MLKQEDWLGDARCTVSGGVAGAAAATLTLMVGGEAENFERAQPILSSLGKKIVHAGVAGSGQAAKICNKFAFGYFDDLVSLKHFHLRKNWIRAKEIL